MYHHIRNKERQYRVKHLGMTKIILISETFLVHNSLLFIMWSTSHYEQESIRYGFEKT